MRITKTILCDLTGYALRTVDVAVGDSMTRAVCCRLLENGVPWIVPAGAEVSVAYLLPDGTPGRYAQMPDGRPAAVIDGSSVTVLLSDRISAQTGIVMVSLVLTDSSGAQLATFPFRVVVSGIRPLRNPAFYPALGAEFAGKLLYGGPGGAVTPLEVGEGLELDGGKLAATGGNGGPAAVPTKLSEFTNDVGFITSAVRDLANYYTKEQTQELISAIPQFAVEVVTELPEVGEEKRLYLVPFANADGTYLEYLWVNGGWEVIGSQRVDLAGYATEEYVQGYAQPKGDYAKPEDIPTKPEDIGAQPAGNYLTEAPVTSVNGKTGAVALTADDVGALPSTYTPPDQTAAQVGADPKGTAAAAVSGHNVSTDAHGDIRLLIEGLATRLNALANSTDKDLDQMAELVAYIKSNKSLIDGITTNKVSVSDIVDNLATNVANKPLSAAQGVALKALFDQIPAWALATSKPGYTKSEVGLGDVDNVRQYSASNPPPYPVTSVNGKTGDIYVPSEAVLYTAQSLTEDQKAQARANIGATAGEEVEYAESVEWLDADGDTKKKYVLPDGYIYEYAEKFVTEKHEANNANALINQKVNTSGDYNTVSAQSGVLTSDIIKFSSAWPSLSAADRPKTTVTISGLEKLVPTYNNYSLWVFYYKADGSFLGAANSAKMGSIGAASGAEISLPKSFYLKDPNYAPSGGWSNVGYVRLVLGISTTGDIAAEDVAALRINCPYYDFEGTRAGWYSTGRQHSNDKATQQNSADIAALKERTDALEAGITELRETMDNNGLTRAQTGEVLYAVGDSITYGTNVGGNSGSWVRHVIDTNGYDAANSKNLGISGIGFCTEASSKTVRTVVDENDFSAADIVTVAIGVNDWKNYNATLESFFSEMEYCLTKIRADNPYCRIFYILPFNWRPSSSSFETFYALGYAGDSNPERPYGNTLQTFVNMIKEKLDEEPLKALDVHVIDMTKTPAITRYNIETALSDGLHPTAECHEALAREIARRIAFA